MPAMKYSNSVIPAKAGIQSLYKFLNRKFPTWIPASAGMTTSIFLSFSFLFIAVQLWAVPNQFRFQGRLTDKQGAPIVGTPSVQFYIYDAASSGSSKWNSAELVVATNEAGLFSIDLGPVPNSIFSQNPELFLEVRVRGVAGVQTLSPRQKLSSVPYAIEAGHALAADSASAIPDDVVTSAKIKMGAVQNVHLSTDSVRSQNIKDGEVGFVDLSVDAVRSANIKDGTIQWVDLSTGTVRSDTISDGSIEEVDIATDTISSRLLRDNAVLARHLAAGAVLNRHLSNGVITNVNISSKSIAPSNIVDGYGLLPSGAIVLWTGPGCPAGYSRFSALDGLFPMGASTYTGVTSGSSTISGLVVASSGTHSHAVNAHSHGIPASSIQHKHETPVMYNSNVGRTDAVTIQPPFGTGGSADGTGYLGFFGVFPPTTGASWELTNEMHPSSYLNGPTGSASPGTDTQGSHTHAIQPLPWRPPHLGILFCQKD